MKIVLFCLVVTLAIFLPASLPAGEVKTVPFFKITQQKYTFDYYQSGRENILFYDLLADTADDETTDTERKKLSSGKSLFHNSSLHPNQFSVSNFNRRLPGGFLVIPRSSLSIFINVLKL
jgi:hypothetical protein